MRTSAGGAWGLLVFPRTPAAGSDMHARTSRAPYVTGPIHTGRDCMTGRITSLPSEDHTQRAVMAAMRLMAWQLVDRWLYEIEERLATKRAVRTQRLKAAESNAAFGYQHGIATCVFHVGFISISETQEQLRLLKNEPLECDFSPCRSRFMRHSLSHYVAPIDATAGRVAGAYREVADATN